MKTFNELDLYENFNSFFGGMTDYRQKVKIKHLLSEILFIVVLATIAGAEDAIDIANYAKSKFKWLSSFLALKNGIPSHDTFNRVLCMINPSEFEARFAGWVAHYKNYLQFKR
jgi:hypothetical protein